MKGPWRLAFSALSLFGKWVPSLDTHRFTRSTRRLQSALALAVAAFMLVVTSMLLTMIDLAVQYEQRGYLTWNAVLWLATGLFFVGVASALGARRVMPGVRDFVPFAPGSVRAARPDGLARALGERVSRGFNRAAASTPMRSAESTPPPRRPEYAH